MENMSNLINIKSSGSLNRNRYGTEVTINKKYVYSLLNL